jgi:quercetin dioxygenase-like cupin family protein
VPSRPPSTDQDDAAEQILSHLEAVEPGHVVGRIRSSAEPHEKAAARREYETVGYVISGRAELTVEGQTLRLEPGDSWLVPAGEEHSYRILETFTAVEATAPPAQVHGRDDRPGNTLAAD